MRWVAIWIIGFILFTLAILIVVHFTFKTIHNKCKNITDFKVVWTSPRGEYNPSVCTINQDVCIVTRQSNIVGQSSVFDLARNYILKHWIPIRRKDHVILYQFQQRHVCSFKPNAKGDFIFEDARIFYSAVDGCLLLSSGLDRQNHSRPFILHLNLNTHTIERVVDLKVQQNGMHKNWTLFRTHDTNILCVLTDVSPEFCIQSVDAYSGQLKIVVRYKSIFPFATIRCTSPPVRWNHQWMIFAAHTVDWGSKYKKLYRTVFVLFQSQHPYHIVAYTDPIHFFDGSQVEFASGLLRFTKKSFLLTLGVNDERGYLIELSKASLRRRFITY